LSKFADFGDLIYPIEFEIEDNTETARCFLPWPTPSKLTVTAG